MAKASILVIDDEKDILKLLQYNLEKEGYRVFCSKKAEEGLETARQQNLDLIVLDLMLPDMDGLELCRILKTERPTKHIPILMLTAKDSETDEVLGLELGACDYIPKPFSVQVLLARVRNILRGLKPEQGKAVLRAGQAVLDKERRSFTLQGKPIAFTKLEFRILSFLMEHRGKVFTRDQLLSGAWEGEAFVVDRTVDVHVRSIRHKLGKHRSCIETVRGSGYRFVEG